MRSRLLEWTGLGAFAFAQPLFDLLGRNPAFLVAHDLSGWRLVLFAVGSVLVVPLAGAVITGLARAGGKRMASVAHGAFALALVAATLLAPLQRGLPFPAVVLLVLAVALAGAGVFAARHRPRIRAIARYGAAAAPIFLILFLARSEVRPLLASADDVAAIEADMGAAPPLLVVVVDALPLASVLDADGALDGGRFPNLAALADDGVWFANTTTNADFTVRAMPALLTGIFPREATVAHHGAWPRNLFTLLAPTHEIRSAEWITALCPPELNALRGQGDGPGTLVRDVALVWAHVVFPESLRRELPPVDQGWRAFGRAGVLGAGTLAQKVAHLDRFVASIGETDRTPFFFLHTVLPHRPYGLYPSGRLYSTRGTEAGGRSEEGRRIRDDEVVRQAWQRHLLQAGFVDRQIGRILSRWREAGYYDSSVIAVIADHGVSFEPGQRPRELTPGNAAEILPVPFVLKLPHLDRAGSVEMRNVESIDFLPTLAGALGIDVPFEVDGQNALDPVEEPRAIKRAINHYSNSESHHPPRLFEAALAVAQERRELFGDDVWRLGDARELVDRLAEEIGDPGAPAEHFSLRSPATIRVEEGSRVLPGEVYGFVGARGRHRAPAEIVVAVDGRIRAVTRPFPAWPGERLAVWYALLPEEALTPGTHRIEAWILDGEERAVLRPPADDAPSPSYVGKPLGSKTFVGVRTTGILEGRTRAADRVEIVAPLRPEEEVSRLDLRVEPLDPSGTRLSVRVNGRELETVELDSTMFVNSYPLDVPAGEPVRIELRGRPRTLDPASEWTFGLIEARLRR